MNPGKTNNVTLIIIKGFVEIMNKYNTLSSDFRIDTEDKLFVVYLFKYLLKTYLHIPSEVKYGFVKVIPNNGEHNSISLSTFWLEIKNGSNVTIVDLFTRLSQSRWYEPVIFNEVIDGEYYYKNLMDYEHDKVVKKYYSDKVKYTNTMRMKKLLEQLNVEALMFPLRQILMMEFLIIVQKVKMSLEQDIGDDAEQ